VTCKLQENMNNCRQETDRNWVLRFWPKTEPVPKTEMKMIFICYFRPKTKANLEVNSSSSNKWLSSCQTSRQRKTWCSTFIM